MDVQLTLRELQRQVLNPRVLAIWAMACVITTISGPFGTNDAPLWFRAVYWTGSISASVLMSAWFIGVATSTPLLGGVDERLRPIIGALTFSLPYSGILTLLDWAVFAGRTGIGGYFGYLTITAPIAVGIAIVVMIFIAAEGSAEAAENQQDDRFFKRLKPGLGRSLIRLAMQDHYLEVHTTKGSQLILLRFSDALAELEGQAGWRIHRSHWIAEAAIKGVRRDGGKTLLIASDGAELPVSRTYLPALRAAGVLKRFA